MRKKRRGRRQPDFAGAVFGGTAGYIGAGAALGYGHLGATVHKAKKQFKSQKVDMKDYFSKNPQAKKWYAHKKAKGEHKAIKTFEKKIQKLTGNTKTQFGDVHFTPQGKFKGVSPSYIHKLKKFGRSPMVTGAVIGSTALGAWIGSKRRRKRR